MGIEQARAAAAAADLVLWLVDASAAPVWPGERPRAPAPDRQQDRLAAGVGSRRSGRRLRISAATGEGVAELVHALSAWLVPDPPPPGAAVPFTEEMIEGLMKDAR